MGTKNLEDFKVNGFKVTADWCMSQFGSAGTLVRKVKINPYTVAWKSFIKMTS